MIADELSLAVVGLDYPDHGKKVATRRFEVLLCQPGEPVYLERDPRNPADPRAVAVFSARFVQIGYLTAERCGMIGARLLAGDRYEAFFQSHGRSSATIRIRFGGGAPTMPPPASIDIEDTGLAPDDYVDWGA